jgi:hypothetical protein
MGLTEDGATVAPPTTTDDQPVTMSMEWVDPWPYPSEPPWPGYDVNDRSTWRLETPREGYTYDPDWPLSWMYCHTCGGELAEIHGGGELYGGDFDIVRCHDCGYEEHI